MTKKVIKSLPNDKHRCNWVSFPTCVMKTVSKNLKKTHNCTLPFLNEDENVNDCSNDVALKTIKELKKALNQQEYYDCLDVKSCNTVRFTASAYFYFVYTYPFTVFQFYYRDFIIEEFEDSYVYSRGGSRIVSSQFLDFFSRESRLVIVSSRNF